VVVLRGLECGWLLLLKVPIVCKSIARAVLGGMEVRCGAVSSKVKRDAKDFPVPGEFLLQRSHPDRWHKKKSR
jgi:hypothetical protein